MSRIWDWLTGQEQARRDAAAAELSRQRTREAQDAGLDRAVGDAAQRQPEAIQRAENEPRPGERWLPATVERQRQMHDHPPVEKTPDPVERRPTEMQYTWTPQPGPSIGGVPGIIWVAKPSTVGDKLLDAGRDHAAKEGPKPEKQPEIKRSPSPFPDYSEGRKLKPPSDKRPGEDDQQ